MATPRRRQGMAISLFPFLSVLACVIGTLTLLIAATAVGAVGEDLWGRLDRAEDEIERSELDIQETQNLIGQALDAEKKVALAKQALANLEAEDLKWQNDATLLARSQEIAETRNGLREDRTRVARDRDELKRKLERLRRARRSTQKIRIQPGGSGINLAPSFVECTSDSLILYENGVQVARIRERRMRTSLSLALFVGKVRRRSNGAVIFLIRPDGVELYRQADYIFTEALGIKTGKLPLAGYGPLDFSAFQP